MPMAAVIAKTSREIPSVGLRSPPATCLRRNMIFLSSFLAATSLNPSCQGLPAIESRHSPLGRRNLPDLLELGRRAARKVPAIAAAEDAPLPGKHAQRRAHRRSPGADQLGDGAVGQWKADADPGAVDMSPAICVVPEEQVQARVDAGVV